MNQPRITAVIDAWVAGKHEAQIASELHVERSLVARIVDAWRDSQRRLRLEKQAERRRKNLEARAVQMADRHAMNHPTPEEIAERCGEIQSTWSDGERRRRYYEARTVGGVTGFTRGYTFPELRTIDWSYG